MLHKQKLFPPLKLSCIGLSVLFLEPVKEIGSLYLDNQFDYQELYGFLCKYAMSHLERWGACQRIKSDIVQPETSSSIRAFANIAQEIAW